MKTKVQTRKSRRNYLIVALIVIMLLLGVGYATLIQTLNITGNVGGSATWDVHFEDATGATTAANGDAVNGTLSNNNHTLTVNVSDLQYPGDAREVTAVIHNNSSMPIKLTGFTVVDPSTGTTPAEADIDFRYVNLTSKVATSGVTTTAVDASSYEVIPADGMCTYKFVLGWKSSSTKTALTTSAYSITFTYEQNTVAPELTATHTGHTM